MATEWRDVVGAIRTGEGLGGPRFPATVSGVVDSVTDGDTVRVFLRLPWERYVRSVAIRVYGVDAAETRSRDAGEKRAALATKELVVRLLGSAGLVLVTLQSEDKYAGRLVGNVYAALRPAPGSAWSDSCRQAARDAARDASVGDGLPADCQPWTADDLATAEPAMPFTLMDLGDTLLRLGLADNYNGGTKRGFREWWRYS